MDLQSKKPGRLPNPALAALADIPNKLRLDAIEAALPYLHTSEHSALAAELLLLAQPESDPNTGPGIRRAIDRAAERVCAPLARRRRAADADIARAAQRHLVARWDRLTPEVRRLALATPAVDWARHAREMLARDESLAAPVGQLLAEIAKRRDADSPATARPSTQRPPAPQRSQADQGWTAADPGKGTRDDDETLRIMLRSSNRDAAESAERTLLARIHAGWSPADATDATDERTPSEDALRDAIAAALLALGTEQGRERTPLVRAALRLLDCPANDPTHSSREPIRAILADPEHPAFAALRRALKRDPAPETRRTAWRALTPGPLALACLERLGNTRTAEEHDAVLASAHLIANPARADLLATLGAPAGSRSTPSARRRTPAGALAPILPPLNVPLAPEAERGLALLIPFADARAAESIRDRLLTSGDGRARLRAVRLAGSADLADSTFDPDASVAEIAATRRSPVGVRAPSAKPDTPERLRHTRLLLRSPHEAVRRIARDDLAASELLTAEGMPTVRAVALARRDPDALAAELGEMLDAGHPRDRISAIRAAVRLRIADRIADRLAQLLAEPAATADDARVAATAAAALGAIPSRRTLPAVLGALDRPDPRVRANAIESLERLAASIEIPGVPDDRLRELKASPEHRARANAIRAAERLRLADTRSTHDDLLEILTDDRAPHRLAGAWLAERLLCDPRRVLGPGDAAWQAAARTVAGLARDEDDPHVRARAVRCARRLLDEINNPRRARRDPAIDEAARRIRALAEAHRDPSALTGDAAPAHNPSPDRQEAPA